MGENIYISYSKKATYRIGENIYISYSKKATYRMGENICKSYLELISKIHKEFIQLNSKTKTSNPI